ncbi:beta-1,6-N-acetylglucosaminyltransferase [Butyrivibrio sp. WCE2006]|uniref:beta-1,6-N-acetylglucosaminyltransferase n=1 Tax=Butyrivibrio sp. WCE2006 TaxID=1410611 RepID=UPI0006788B7F|nr:beta-1,6-N-acetylglucosaminyltransferase [Butyrivibrio sp. WCE2006]
MKHAFLIIAHNNWWQLKQLIKQLDSEFHDIYIHIDKRCKDFDQGIFSEMTLKSKIYFFQEYKVYWGGYSLVEVELFLLENAFRNNYDYYHIISGGDLLITSNQEFDAFFENNKGFEFIDFDDNKLINDPEILRRVRLYHFLQNFRRISGSSFINSIFVFFERCLLLLQIILQIDRTKKLNWTIKYGSQWVSITNDLTKEVLNHKKNVKEVFRFTNCADELFIQTIAYNSMFRDKIFENEIDSLMNNMRVVDWKRGKNGSPYTFCSSDFENIIHSKGLFARKFSEEIDKEIILKINNYVNGVDYEISL